MVRQRVHILKITILLLIFLNSILVFGNDLTNIHSKGARYVTAWYLVPNSISTIKEVIVKKSTPGTYFCAVGFDMGYFGLQELGNGKKTFIFSVWDDNRGDDPTVVSAENRVKALQVGENVRIQRFGNEGTGIQTFLDHNWLNDTPYLFRVEATSDNGHTIFSAKVFIPEINKWQLMAILKTPANTSYIANQYSFIEDFLRSDSSHMIKRTAQFRDMGSIDQFGNHVTTRKIYFAPVPESPFGNVNLRKSINNSFIMETGGNTINVTKPGSYVELSQETSKL